MKHVLVTGATGFLGEHLCRELRARGIRVRAMARTPSAALEAMGVRFVAGDLSRDDAPLAEAIEGVDGVFHLAGLVSRNPGDGQRMMRLHVDGTRRLLDAIAALARPRTKREKARKPPRVLIASTSGTIAASREAPDPLPTESAPYPLDVVSGWPYYVSKIYQEKLALERGQALGIDVVFVNPSLLLGPGDTRYSSTLDVARFLRKEVPIVPVGGANFVDVRDVAPACVAAMERGKPGDRFLLGAANWTVEKLFGHLERLSKVRGPRIKAPRRMATLGAELLEQYYRWRDREPPVERISVEMGYAYWYFDWSKAARQLGFSPRDPNETLDATIRFCRTGIADDGSPRTAGARSPV